VSISNVPKSEYGVLCRDRLESEIDEAAEQVRRLGYAVLDSGLTVSQVQVVQRDFDSAARRYIERYGEQRLRRLNEHNTIRALLTDQRSCFMAMATNPNLLAVLQRLIVGKFMLNQQNGIINPPSETYNQAAWHRDLPYQHFVSSSPLALNALFCVDDFTAENGSTFVLPASHKAMAFPSERYIETNAIQLEAKAGQFIILDCMLFHAGGYNATDRPRRAVNHVYTIPYIKQQIRLPAIMSQDGLDDAQRELFGFNYQEPMSIEEYLGNRE
jgi:ectoine hydroxylase-related dioxygenase (phytanoyl-CoA dioxygenase family)